jgi:hypothetical protein
MVVLLLPVLHTLYDVEVLCMALHVDAQATTVDYPDTDGIPIAESDFQCKPLTYAVEALDIYFQNRPDVTPSSLPPSSSSRAGCPSPATRPVRALRCEPAACRRHPALASRWRGACGPTPGAGRSGQSGSRVAAGWADAVGGKGRLIFLSPGMVGYRHRARSVGMFVVVV